MDLKLSLDQQSDLPLHIQVFNELRDLILSGRLKPGLPLPSTRVLAEQVFISRNTVILGYDRLSAEGYIETRGTAGTFVSSSLPDDLLNVTNVPEYEKTSTVEPEPVLCFAGTPGGHGASSRPEIDFWVGRSAAESFPLRVWRKLVLQKLNSHDFHIADYSDPVGLKDLREAISEHLSHSRGMATNPEQIAVTGGSQDGLNFILRLTQPIYKTVFVENPCYQGAAHLFKSVGLQVVPIPVDDSGLRVDELPLAKSSLVFVTPSHQFPTGCTLSLERRFQLIEWAEKTDSLIIEDDYDSDFRYDGPPLTALAGLNNCRRVFYLGTFSKSLGAGLRMGYTIVPHSFQDDIRQTRAFMSNGQPWLEQVVLSEFLKLGEFNRHLRRVRKIYKERRDTLIECLEEYFPETKISGSTGGLHLVWTLPKSFPTATELQALARTEDIGLYSLRSGAVVDFNTESADDTLILGYSSVEPQKIKNAIKILRTLCDRAAQKTKARSAA